MAKVVKKKRKLGGRGFGGGGGGGGHQQESNLRPRIVPKRPPCSAEGCPIGNDIRSMIMTIGRSEDFGRTVEESLKQSWEILTNTNPLPAICGRVCPHPCEDACNRGKKDDGAVSINAVERAIGDFGLKEGLALKGIEGETPKSEKIAIVGSGPAGLACAYQLARRGYKATIFEAFAKPGGMLRYGIPAYRLPRDILDGEIQRILDLGVQLRCETIVGKDITFEDLKSQHAVVFVAIGAHKGRLLGAPGEDAPNVFSGTEFLNQANAGRPPEVGKQVLIVGGGDTAIDAARLCRRLGAEVTIVYRRTIAEMPAIEEEIQEAQNEDIKLEFLAAPIEILQDGDRAVAMRCQRMELGEPDSSGRRRPVPIEGSEFTIQTDAIIAAISQEPDFQGLEHLREGRDWIKVNQDRLTLKDPATYAGGDVIDLGLVTHAIAHGNQAAQAIHHRLSGLQPSPASAEPIIKADKMRLDLYDPKDRQKAQILPVSERLNSLEREVNLGLNPDQLLQETQRCLSCGACYDCGRCWMYCQDNAVIKPQDQKGQDPQFKMDFCTGCKKCAEECPCGLIIME